MKSDFAFGTSRRFIPLFFTQFAGAFNDNLFKTAVFVLITFHGLGNNENFPAAQLLNIGMMLFILPYFLFSSLSGEISTRFNKARVARWVKVAEIVIMALAVYGFFQQSVSILLACLFMMGTQSTLFGPLKYAILPDYLHENELILGNGLIESGTFLAILLGQILATATAGNATIVIYIVLIFLAISGTISAFYMPDVPAKNPHTPIHFNIASSSKNLLRQTFRQPQLRTAIIGISWFWFIGSVYTTQLPTFTELHLGGNQNVFNLLLTLFSIGIGTGSVVCAKICHGRLNLRWVIYGAIGMAIFGIVLAWLTRHHYQGEIQTFRQFIAQSRHYPILLCIIALGFFGGFFSVPLYTWLQKSSSDTFRAQAVAANNIVNGLFMVCAAIASSILLLLVNNISLLYLLTALGNPLIIYILLKLSPEIWHNTQEKKS